MCLKKDGACQKDKGASLKEFSLAKSVITRILKDIKILVDYNPLSKIKIRVSIRIINKQMEKGNLFLTTEFQPINTEEIGKVARIIPGELYG